MLPWAGRFGCISCLGSLRVSLGWLFCAFQWTVCVWMFCGDSVDWWLCVNCLDGIYVYIFWIKGLLIMYTWHLNQQFPRILTLHLHSKMRLNVSLHFVTLFMLLIHCIAREDNEYRYGTCSCLLLGTIPSPPPHPAIISPSYIKHTGLTKNESVQNLNKYVFADSLDKNMHNDTD